MIIGVINNEYAPTGYAIRTYVADMEESFNASANRTELRELSRSPLDRLSLSIGHGQEWNRSYTFRIDRPGIFRVVFLLFKLPDERNAYRTLWLTVRVRASWSAEYAPPMPSGQHPSALHVRESA